MVILNMAVPGSPFDYDLLTRSPVILTDSPFDSDTPW